MNSKPISYKQYDPAWARNPYRTAGEISTIQSAGCGPTCAAMCIATLKDRAVTPAVTAKWAMEHGYKAKGNGTAWAYFEPQLAAYGIGCCRVQYTEAMELLKKGWYIIAAMGRGLWTTGGHFVLAWWADSKVRINDPASTATARENGDPALFKAQAEAMWAVDASAYNKDGNAQRGVWLPRDGRIDSVAEVQSWLNREYAAGLDVDGKYGKQTQAAIVASLQVECGMTGRDVDGVAGAKTCKALPVIRKGSSGRFVMLLQCVLVCLGYTDAYVDGAAGNGTETAIKAVQRKYRLLADGVCGKNTWRRILNFV